uniref:Uncharacterized protein n=1 Tax=Desertifilum tharense IPPAS B-1220 TaxID=1781255 RepID=A0ACD5GWF0_9CYAN
MRTPVIAIGLDAADPTLIEQWMAQGHLKTLSRLREQGAYTRINNIEHYRAETPWTTFLTGCLPDKTGYWSPVKFHEGTYIAQEVGAYDFKEYQPFYALGEDYRVAVFDMPQSTLAQNANGVQVLAWGAHSALTPSHSQPASIYEELIQKHGEHPVLWLRSCQYPRCRRHEGAQRKTRNWDCSSFRHLPRLATARRLGFLPDHFRRNPFRRAISSGTSANRIIPCMLRLPRKWVTI